MKRHASPESHWGCWKSAPGGRRPEGMDRVVLSADPTDPRRWRLTGPQEGGSLAGMNEYLGYLADRNYSPRTVRTYAYGLLAFARWLTAAG